MFFFDRAGKESDEVDTALRKLEGRRMAAEATLTEVAACNHSLHELLDMERKKV